MGLPIVRMGDKTSSGGVVVSASLTHFIMGLGIARVGDLVTCPITAHGVNRILEGAATFTVGGKSVALDGHRCACGCTLIASMKTASYG